MLRFVLMLETSHNDVVCATACFSAPAHLRCVALCGVFVCVQVGVFFFANVCAVVLLLEYTHTNIYPSNEF